ncbi:CHASE domain-containing hybrid sensor histidine kinase/response regulator [Metapseudomonas otitidis]|uniref:CHASE domain-containing hybrid sensor histidine kinase/response regulator n=1 Tax=Metapseudomonas otitidis TaxID=319939 RepID=UPI00261902CA|nr:CHASE domain-containing protein [Pseudomonas otitidis]
MIRRQAVIVVAWMLVVLGAGLLASLLVSQHQANRNQSFIHQILLNDGKLIEHELIGRLDIYTYRLRSIRGAIYMLQLPNVTRDLLARFGRVRDIEKEFPGARGFGFIRRVAPEDEAAFLRRARADGMPDFSIRQFATHAGERYVIEFVDPAQRNQAAFGLDIASETRRRLAAVTAMNTGQPTLTAPITLVQESVEPSRAFLLLLPVYATPDTPPTVEERQRNTLGWAYAPLSMQEVMRSMTYPASDLHLTLYDVVDSNTSHLIYDSLPDHVDDGVASASFQREVYGRTWRFEITPHASYIQRLELPSPERVFGIGTLASLLLTGMTGALLVSRQRQRTISAQQARLATIIENSRDAIIGEALDGTIVTWNPAAEQMFGYRADEVIGRPLAPLLVPPERFSEDEDLLERVSRGELGSTLETQRRHKQGHLIDVAITCSLIREPDGTILAAAKLMHDISDRLRAENYLREFSAKLELEVSQRTAELSRLAGLLQGVLNASSEVSIIATDTHGRVAIFNRGAERLLGYRADDAVGLLSILSLHEQGEINRRGEELSAEAGRRVQGLEVLCLKADSEGAETREWTYIRQDGSAVPVSMVMTAIRTTGGEAIGYLSIAQDITERRRSSEELRAATVAAERANAAKSLFLANMSHEIRTPMNAVIGVAHLLQNTPLNEEQRNLLGKLEIAGRSLLGIINDILDIAKIEAGEMRLESRPFSLRQVLQELGELFSPQAEAKGLGFTLEGLDELPAQVLGDSLRINQILMNLVGNALKFTATGQITVRVACREVHAEQVRVTLTVVDTGCGIAADVVDQLFSPFTQADASTTRRFGGTGLGLSVVRGLAEQMGGSAGVRSVLGQGSEFWVEIPLEIAQTDLDATATARSLEVVVVDDSEADRQQLARHCRGLGWRVRMLDSGEALLDLLRERVQHGFQLPDVLLVDWQMPGLDGVAVLEESARILAPTRLPSSLLVSAHELDGYVRASGGLVDQALRKPVDSSSLFNAVNSAVVRHLGNTEKVMLGTDLDTRSTRWLEGTRLLLVDDSEINLEVASLLLGQQGAEVDTAMNGREAVQRLEQAPDHYDAVLMDVQMPEMDGYEATRTLRGKLGLTRLPVIALTAGALAEERRQAEAAGMNEFLSKPLEPTSLIRTLRRLIEQFRLEPLPVRNLSARLEQKDEQAWPVIPGIDAREAANRLGNDIDLFLGSLNKLFNEFADLEDTQLAQQLLSRDAAALAGKLHKLRGSAGLLGAMALHRACGDGESSIRRPAGSAEQRLALQQVSEALVALRAAAAPYLETQLGTPASGPQDAGEAEQALQRLVSQLQGRDMAAIDTFPDAVAALLAKGGQALADAAWKAVDDLQFDQALDVLAAHGLIDDEGSEHA